MLLLIKGTNQVREFDDAPADAIPPEYELISQERFDAGGYVMYDPNNPIVAVPDEIALWRLRVILASMSLTNAVNEALEYLPEPNKTAALLAWEYGTVVLRESPTVKYLQTALNLSDKVVDQIFIQADAIDI